MVVPYNPSPHTCKLSLFTTCCSYLKISYNPNTVSNMHSGRDKSQNSNRIIPSKRYVTCTTFKNMFFEIFKFSPEPVIPHIKAIVV